jgi:hypothetical protein
VIPRVDEHPVALLREVSVDRNHAPGIVGEGEAARAQQPGANVRYLQRHGVNRPQIFEGISNKVRMSKSISDPVIEWFPWATIFNFEQNQALVPTVRRHGRVQCIFSIEGVGIEHADALEGFAT